jgi:hypothetical protein
MGEGTELTEWAKQTGAERRAKPRARVALDCMLTRVRGNAIAGATIDLGTGGALISTARPLRIDETVRMVLRLDDGDPAPVVARARVLRQTGSHAYALRFMTLDQGAVERLRPFVAARVGLLH